MDKRNLLLIQIACVDEIGERLHGSIMIELNKLSHQKPEGRVAESALIVVRTAQLMSKDALQLAEFILGHRQVPMQLLYHKRISVVAHPALDLHLVVGEVLTQARRNAIHNLGNRVGKMRYHIAAPVTLLKKAKEPAQLTANLLELKHRDVGHEPLVGD